MFVMGGSMELQGCNGVPVFKGPEVSCVRHWFLPSCYSSCPFVVGLLDWGDRHPEDKMLFAFDPDGGGKGFLIIAEEGFLLSQV